jgi:hypothetical protein
VQVRRVVETHLQPRSLDTSHLEMAAMSVRFEPSIIDQVLADDATNAATGR